MGCRYACLICIVLAQGCSSQDKSAASEASAGSLTNGSAAADNTGSTHGSVGGSSDTMASAATSDTGGASSGGDGEASMSSTIGESGGAGDAATDGPSGAGGAAGDSSHGGSGGIPEGFRDSFEDGDLSPWAPGPEGGDATVTEETAVGGDYSLRVPGDVFYYAGPNIIFEQPIQATYVSWWVRFTGGLPGNNGVAHFALSADDAALDELVQVWAARDGFLFDGASAQPIGGNSPEEDIWYHLEMRIDWTTRIANLSVDGTEILKGELAGTSHAIARLDLFTVEGVASYFDEIEVRP